MAFAVQPRVWDFNILMAHKQRLRKCLLIHDWDTARALDHLVLRTLNSPMPFWVMLFPDPKLWTVLLWGQIDPKPLSLACETFCHFTSIRLSSPIYFTRYILYLGFQNYWLTGLSTSHPPPGAKAQFWSRHFTLSQPFTSLRIWSQLASPGLSHSSTSSLSPFLAGACDVQNSFHGPKPIPEASPH